MMNEPRVRELLTEVAGAVEPGERLDAIRARTRRSRSRAHLWVPAGAALVAASVVGAVALAGGPTERAAEPGPGGTTSTPPTPSDPTELPDAVARPVPVYFVGETPEGPRLFREFQRGDGPESADMFGLTAAVQGDAIDGDYRSAWPEGTSIGGYSMQSGEIVVDVVGDLHDRPPGMPRYEADLAIQQLVYTAQALLGEGRVPVRLRLNGSITDQLLGVPTSEPLANAPVLETLAHVSLTSPAEGEVVDNDDPLVVSGAGNSYEGNIVTRVQGLDGTEVVEPAPTIAGWMEDRLFPFEVTLDLSDVPPGEYLVVSQTDDPSGNQLFHEDTRQITVTD